jgi:hypothetical protein
MGVVALAVQNSMQIERVMSVELSVWQAVWVRVPETQMMPGRFFLRGRK